jgi:hypothetical protein
MDCQTAHPKLGLEVIKIWELGYGIYSIQAFPFIVIEISISWQQLLLLPRKN